ncbi:MAG TPA: hypothetical protein VLF67_04470 [Candidatus Saccharimonas sp.]|nr:hypothetical protein [Candidatus Saccharimonas sp.]
MTKGPTPRAVGALVISRDLILLMRRGRAVLWSAPCGELSGADQAAAATELAKKQAYAIVQPQRLVGITTDFGDVLGPIAWWSCTLLQPLPGSDDPSYQLLGADYRHLEWVKLQDVSHYPLVPALHQLFAGHYANLELFFS